MRKEGATLGAGHRSAGAGRDAGVRAWSNNPTSIQTQTQTKEPSGPEAGDTEAG